MGLDVKIVHLVAKSLDIDSNRFTKEGVVYMTMRKLFSLMPNKCNNCNKIVTHASEAKEINCVGCTAALCANCNSGNSCVCNSCLTWIKERYSPPEEYFKKVFLKKQPVETDKNKKTMEELMDETDTDFTQRNLPPAQRPAETVTSEVTANEENSNVLESTRTSELNLDITVKEDCFTTVKNKKEEKKDKQKKKNEEEKRKKEEEEKKKEQEEEQKKVDCKHFLRNACRHGFSGNTPKNGIQKCRFNHPEVCRRFLNNGSGPGGCLNGENCSKIHPKMCGHSLNDKRCPFMGPGKSCRGGYHLRGTVLATPSPQTEVPS